MGRVHVYADESGNFDFSLGRDASRYFVLTTVTFFDDRGARSDLDELRHEMAWSGLGLPEHFHASENSQDIRDLVFELLSRHDFRVDATILEKRKANDRLRASDVTFYRYAWYFHARHFLPAIARSGEDILLVVASIGTRRKRQAFRAAVVEAIGHVQLPSDVRTTHWSGASDIGLQIADYCSWAIFRKWERQDDRSYLLIEDKVRQEHDLFASGEQSFY